MLVLKRKENEWVEIQHAASGDILKIRLYNIGRNNRKRADMAFDDDDRNFLIHRPERVTVPQTQQA